MVKNIYIRNIEITYKREGDKREISVIKMEALICVHFSLMFILLWFLSNAPSVQILESNINLYQTVSPQLWATYHWATTHYSSLKYARSMLILVIHNENNIVFHVAFVDDHGISAAARALSTNATGITVW